MSGPICVKILKYECIWKNFSFLCRQFFPFISLKQTIFFSQLQLANNFFYQEGSPPDKNNGPFLIFKSLANSTIFTPVFCLHQYHFHEINGNLMLVWTFLFVGEKVPNLVSHHLRHISKLLSFSNFDLGMLNGHFSKMMTS